MIAKEWDAQKAFSVMVKANRNYWTTSTNFCEGAQYAYQSAKDLKYDADVVAKAFLAVGIDVKTCK